MTKESLQKEIDELSKKIQDAGFRLKASWGDEYGGIQSVSPNIDLTVMCGCELKYKIVQRSDDHAWKTTTITTTPVEKEEPSICSKHQKYDPECNLCNAKPWDLLKITKSNWEQKVEEAEATGIIKCPECHFEQYKNHLYCVMCDHSFLDN